MPRYISNLIKAERNGKFVVYNLRIEKMCTIFAKKSFEDRKNVPASSKGAAQGRATVQQGVVAGSAPAARRPQCDLLSLAGKRHAVAT